MFEWPNLSNRDYAFLGAPSELADPEPGAVAIIGAPFDTTSPSRGAQFGPRAIRDASQYVGAKLRLSDHGLIDLESGRIFNQLGAGMLFDLGDVPIYPGSIERTTISIRERVADTVSRGMFPVVIGGDRFVSYPSFLGLCDGLRSSDREERLGFVYVDSHFDLSDTDFTGVGAWHNSTARRICELGTVDVHQMVWLGINGHVPSDEYEYAKRAGITFFTSDDIRRMGMVDVVDQAISKVSAGTDGIYLSLSISAVDSLYAAGTTALTWGGITANDLLRGMDVIGQAKVVGMDLVDVAPALDPTDATARLAVLALIRLLAPRVFSSD